MATRADVTSGFAAGWPFGADAASGPILVQAIARRFEVPASTRCAAPGCGEDGRFLLNGSSACSRRCLETMMRSVLLRKQTHAPGAPRKPRSDVRIGSILVSRGVVTEAQLARALRAQSSSGAGRLGCWLKQQSNLSDADLTAALAVQWRCPLYRLDSFSPCEMAPVLPRWIAESGGAIPLRISGQPQRLALAFEDHIDDEVTRAVEQILGIGVDPGLLTASEFWHATRELLGVRFAPSARLRVNSFNGMVEALSHALTEAGAAIARMATIQGNCWLRLWVASASNGLVPRDVLCEGDANAHSLNAAGVTDEVEGLYRAEEGIRAARDLCTH